MEDYANQAYSAHVQLQILDVPLENNVLFSPRKVAQRAAADAIAKRRDDVLRESGQKAKPSTR